MGIYIDPPQWPARGRLWSHLISDTSFDQLHAFARATGIPAGGVRCRSLRHSLRPACGMRRRRRVSVPIT